MPDRRQGRRRPGRPSYRRLKPGPGRAAEDVAAHQRGRLQAAMVELVAEDGYDAVTIAALTLRAGVSKRDFYRHFTGKEECFLATYDEIVRSSLRGILAASSDADDWSERIREGFQTFAGQIASSPEAGRLALVEVFAAGPEAVERMLHTNQLFETLAAKNFSHADGGAELPPLVVKGIVAGGSRVARVRLLSNRARDLRFDGEELMAWALSFCDDAVVRLRGLGGPEVAPRPEGAVDGALALGDERTLILAAAAKLAADDGYGELTVSRIRRAAGVSRRSFDAHFEDVADAFLATLDLLGDRVLAAASPAYRTADEWAVGVHRMIIAVCEQLALDPVLARLAFQEVLSPGPPAIRWRVELIARLATHLRDGAEATHRPEELAAEASVGAIWGVIHYFVATGRVALLPKAAPTLSYLALAPSLGAGAVVDLIETEEDPGRRLLCA